MKYAFLFAILTLIAGRMPAQTMPGKKNPGSLRVSDDHRTLVHLNGQLFFWLADTGWELFHRLNKEEVNQYFRTRASQGFTVIQAVALAELDGLHVPNAYGELPLDNDDPLKPREAYFSYVEWIIDRAADYGLYIALLPTWGDKVFKDKWGKGPEIFNVATAAAYGKWIGDRFKNKSNVIWVMGGDRNPRNDADADIWRSLAAGVKAGLQPAANALMTFHPQPSLTCSSSPWFHQNDWLSFNMLQTGHCRDTKVWQLIGHDYNLQPVKPAINGESIYEDHPVCFNAKELGYSNAYDIRKAAYLSVFSGSAGYTYGCHAVWQFYAPPREGVNGPLKTWRESLGLPAASQLFHLKNLISGLPAWPAPSQELLLDTLEGTNRIQAVRSGNIIVVYSAGGQPFRLKSPSVAALSFAKGYWYDPRTGKKQALARSSLQASASFAPPSKGEGNDWVLVLAR